MSSPLSTPVGEQRKAILAALVAGTGAFATAVIDNSIVLGEWGTIIAFTVAAYAGVFGVSNNAPSNTTRIGYGEFPDDVVRDDHM